MLNVIKKKARRYKLEAEFINEYTLKVYSKQFDFDTWLIIETKETIRLMHSSKKHNNKKCSYHLQREVEKYEGIYLLENISDHNRYQAFFKGFNKTNLVDRILNREVPRFTVK